MTDLSVLGILAFQAWTLCVEISLSGPLIFLCQSCLALEKKMQPCTVKAAEVFWENVSCNHEILIVIIHSPGNDVQELRRLRHMFIIVLTPRFSAWYRRRSTGLGDKMGDLTAGLFILVESLLHCTKSFLYEFLNLIPRRTLWENTFPFTEEDTEG